MKNSKALPLVAGTILLAGNLFICMLIWNVWQAGPQNFGDPVLAPIGVTAIPRSYPDLCPGEIVWDDQVDKQIITADQNGRAGQVGILDWNFNADMPVGDFEFLTIAGGRDPRDGCPYEILIIKGSSNAYGIKRDSAGLNGHYSVIPVQMLYTPTRMIDVTFSNDGVLFLYETESNGEVFESVDFEGNFPVG